MLSSLRTLIPLTVFTLVLVSYNYLNAQWTAAPAAAPLSNVSAPINVSTASQVKLGGLGTGALSVTGAMSLAGALGVTSTAPQLTFSDTDYTSGVNKFWLYNNSGSMFFLADRNRDGSSAGDSPWPMQTFASSSVSGDFTRFSNQMIAPVVIGQTEVRSDRYCNEAGSDCFVPSSNISSPTIRFNALQASEMGWNSNYGVPYPTSASVLKSQNDICFFTSVENSVTNDNIEAGNGRCTLSETATTWVLTAGAEKRTNTICRASCLQF